MDLLALQESTSWMFYIKSSYNVFDIQFFQIDLGICSIVEP